MRRLKRIWARRRSILSLAQRIEPIKLRATHTGCVLSVIFFGEYDSQCTGVVLISNASTEDHAETLRAQTDTPVTTTLNPSANHWAGREDAILEALRSSEEWVVRRVDKLSYHVDSEATRTHSFDFEVPESLRTFAESPDVSYVPIGFWWKSPGQYFALDLVDETGQSLPLQTTAQSQRLTRDVLFAFACQLLGLSNPTELRYTTAFNIQAIIQRSRQDSYAIYKSVWDAAQSTPDEQTVEDDPENPQLEKQIVTLAKNGEFLAMLQQCTLASILLLPVFGGCDRRRIVKLSYSTNPPRISRAGAEESLRMRPFGRAWRALGQSAYNIQIANSFVRARSYHLEATPPDGMRFANSSRLIITTIKSEPSAPNHAQVRREHAPGIPLDRTMHFHLGATDLTGATHAIFRAPMIVVDDWIDAAWVLTFVTMWVFYGLAENLDSLTSSASQNLVTLAIVAPSVATSIIWRRVPWQVRRLHGWLRTAFGLVGLLSFYVALRIAETPIIDGEKSEEVKTTLSQISGICELGLGFGAVVLLLLLSARFRVAGRRRVARP